MTEVASDRGIFGAIAAAAGREDEDEAANLWDDLAERVDPAAFKPELAPDVEVKTFHLRWGNDYAMIANPTDLLHYQLQIGDVPLLALMDGTRTVRQIVVERFQESGDMDLDGVADLVRELRQGNFLTDRFVDVREMVKEAADVMSGHEFEARHDPAKSGFGGHGCRLPEVCPLCARGKQVTE